MIETILSFIAFTLFAATTLGYLYYFYQREREFEERQDESFEKSQQILHHAHQKANEIVTKASQKANEVLTTAQGLHEGIQADANKTLQAALQQSNELLKNETQSFLALHQEALKKLHHEYKKQIDTSVTNVKESTETELKGFLDLLRKETLEAQKFIGDKITLEFEAARAEIAAYKTKKLAEIDATIQQRVVTIAQDVLGKSIPLEKHEKLVLEALEKAKQEGVLNG